MLYKLSMPLCVCDRFSGKNPQTPLTNLIYDTWRASVDLLDDPSILTSVAYQENSV